MTRLPSKQSRFGIAHLAYRLPAHKHTLEELASAGLIRSSVPVLREFGFGHCHINQCDSISDLLVACGEEALRTSGVSPSSVERVFMYSGLNQLVQAPPEGGLLSLFRYPVAEIRHKLQLTHAHAMGMSQQGCNGLLASIDLARQLLASSDNAVLCLAADFLPPHANREIMYNVMSDAAAAALVMKSDKNRIVHFHQQFHSYYWDTPNRENELLASYFPMAQRTISKTLEETGLTANDIAWFVPHNVSQRSWEILAKLLSVPMEKIWTQNIKRVGHTVSCDHIINLVDMERGGFVKSGDYLALFTFGFGASWSCMIVQH